MKLSLFYYLNNAKHREVLSKVTNNTLQKKKKEKRSITDPFFKL